MEWIKINKKQPEKRVEVLFLVKRVLADLTHCEVGYYDEGKFFNHSIGELERPGFDHEYFKVTHWMELPTKPEN